LYAPRLMLGVRRTCFGVTTAEIIEIVGRDVFEGSDLGLSTRL